MNRLFHTPEGVRDIYNGECQEKLVLQENLHKVLRTYGYQDIETPTFEYFDVFSSEVGTTPSKDLYKFFDREGNTLVLRSDFTPSIARAAAMYFLEEEMPIRLCYTGNTFVNNSSYQGRLKESTEMGVELIGEGHADSDAELIAMTIELLKKSGLKDFQVSIGQVDFFKSLIEESKMEETVVEELRQMISNKNYFGVEEVISTLGLGKELEDAFLALPKLFGSCEVLNQAKAITSNPRALAAINRLEEIWKVLSFYGCEQYVSFDLGMLSKYNYYTGIIFQAYTYGVGEPVVKGGRYDHLLAHFGKKAPAIGFAVVIDAIMSALSRQNLKTPVSCSNLIVLYEQEQKELAISLSKKYRQEGKNVELVIFDTTKQLYDYKTYGLRSQASDMLYLTKEEKALKVNLDTDEITELDVNTL
ncbi:MAG: ATP phosphoribosyltransferase regulatory subunit [Lachnospiraceae bacterium]|nr:ATP phosphoribosyltransferase regulatory subunit [Lachnospiraceae bacterium]MDD3614995.1 ATP phosphoribosyltransferase regulatory subunit [Lachnospiraceae bacterium]